MLGATCHRYCSALYVLLLCRQNIQYKRTTMRPCSHTVHVVVLHLGFKKSVDRKPLRPVASAWRAGCAGNGGWRSVGARVQPFGNPRLWLPQVSKGASPKVRNHNYIPVISAPFLIPICFHGCNLLYLSLSPMPHLLPSLRTSRFQ